MPAYVTVNRLLCIAGCFVLLAGCSESPPTEESEVNPTSPAEHKTTQNKEVANTQTLKTSEPPADTGTNLRAALGYTIFQAQKCGLCHAMKGEFKSGPPLKGVWGTKVKLEDGSHVTMDEAYVRESILEPKKKITKGYIHVPMPGYKGKLTEDEMGALVEYLKSAK